MNEFYTTKRMPAYERATGTEETDLPDWEEDNNNQ